MRRASSSSAGCPIMAETIDAKTPPKVGYHYVADGLRNAADVMDSQTAQLLRLRAENERLRRLEPSPCRTVACAVAVLEDHDMLEEADRLRDRAAPPTEETGR